MRSKILSIIAIFGLTFHLPVHGQDLTPKQDSVLWGYVNVSHVLVIKPQYQYAGPFDNGFAVVAVKDSFGVIDKDNHIVIPLQYGFVRNVAPGHFLFGNHTKSWGDYRLGIITAQNKVLIKPAFHDILPAHGKYIVVKQVDSVITGGDGKSMRSLSSRYGMYGQTGNEVIPCRYSFLTFLDDDFITVNGVYGKALFSSAGKQLTPFKYVEIDKPQGGLLKVEMGDKFGYIDPLGKEVIPPVKYKMCYAFSEGFAVVVTANGFGLIDKKGKEVIKDGYQRLMSASLGTVTAEKADRWGLISTKGKQLTPLIYDEVKRQYKGVIAVRQGGKWAIFSSLGKQLTPFRYDDVQLLDFDEIADTKLELAAYQGLGNKRALVKLNNKWGIADRLGKEVYQPVYTYDEMAAKCKVK